MRAFLSKYILIGLVCVLVVGGIVTLLVNTGLIRWTLTVATGPTLEGGPLFLTTVTQVFVEERPHVRLQRIQTDSMADSAKALETGKADLAVVRSDIAMPKNGLSIAIFRRDSLLLVVPAHSSISGLHGLAGKKVGMLKGGTAEQDQHLGRLLDMVLGFYNISPQRVERAFLSLDEVGPAIAKKEVAGVLALGPVGAGPIAKAIAAVNHATKSVPNLVGEKQADAIAKLHPGLESNEVEAGAFGGASPRPEEDLTTLAVTYRLVGRYSLPDFVAGEIARLLFLAKARLLPDSPMAMQIEAPEGEDNNDGLPAHPGAAAFFSGEQASLVDSATSIFYLASIILGILGSGFAWLLGPWGKDSANARTEVERLIAIMREARTADAAGLEKLEDEIDEIVARLFGDGTLKSLDADQLNILAIVIRQARLAIDKKRHAKA